MVDILPLQVASYQWLTGAHDWIYKASTDAAEWERQARIVCDLVGGQYTENPYYYAPFVAAGLSPFAKLPAEYLRNALFAINFCLIFVNSWFILRLCRIPLTARAFAWASVIPLIAYPLSRATMLGQIVPLLAVLLWFGLLLARDNRNVISGILIGAAGAVKLFPLGIVVVFAVARRWRLLMVTLTTAAVLYGLSLLLLGINIHLLWWNSVSKFGMMVAGFWGNQSAIGWFGRLFLDFDILSMSMHSGETIDLLRVLSGVVFIGGSIVWIVLQRNKINEQNFLLFIGVLLAGILLACANSWEHYWLFCLPVLGWAIREVWREGRIGWPQLWIALAAFFYLMKLTRFYTDTDFGRLTSGSQTVGMLMLWGWLMWRLGRSDSHSISSTAESSV